MEITKQYIENNLLNKNGALNPNLTRKLKESPEELYLIYNEMEMPYCIGGNKAKFKSFTKGHYNICGTLGCECYKERYRRTMRTLKKTNLERYGVECNLSLKSNREKEKATKLERYGDENYNNRIKEKATKLERYGDENYNNHIKAKATKLEKYGDENYTNPDKAKETKLERYGDENYNNHDKAVPKRRKTMEENGSIVPLSQMSDWEYYKSKVRKITEKSYKDHKHVINPNDYSRVLCGCDGHQLDHIESVYSGFINNVPIHIMGHPNNLQMLTWEANRSKGS